MRHLSKRISIITGAVLVLAGGGTAAAAIVSSPVSNSGVINGCYANVAVNGSHLFVLQDQGTNCPKGTTPVTWNQAGPAGPAGPSTAGPGGLDVIIVGSSAIYAQNPPTIVAQCPADHPYVTGGGYNDIDGIPGPYGLVTRSAPGEPPASGATGDWVVTAWGPNGSLPNIAVYAICAK